MESATIDSMCRCCAAEGIFKDIKTSYHWMGEEEVYGDMLRECLDVKLSSVEEGGICEVCITQLRNAANFKKQVLHTEKKFKRHLESRRFKPTEVKEEVSGDNDNNSSDDDRGVDSEDDEDYVPEFEIPIKTESLEESKSRKRTAKATTSRAKKSRVDDDKSFEDDIIEMEPDGSFKVGDTTYIIDASEDSNNDGDIKPKLVCKQENKPAKGTKSTFTSNSKLSAKMQVITERKAVQPLTIIEKYLKKSTPKYAESIAAKMELEKHRYNIRTILQCSNATPIRLHFLGSGYVCCFCKASFLKAADLKNHTIVDHNIAKNKFKPRGCLPNLMVKLDITSLCCNICDFAPNNLDQLIEHLNNIHDKKLHTDIKSHIVSFKLDEEGFKCHNCSMEFNSFRFLLSHLNKYFSNFLCDVCGAGFVNRFQLLFHSDSHKSGSHKCSFCEKTFLSELRRKTHEHRTHISSSEIYRCFHCGERFKNRTLKKNHMVDVHGAKYADLKCNACDKTFRNSKCLDAHRKKDHLMKRWSCKLCDKEFCRPDRLKQHELVHSGVRNFTCEVCTKSFGRKSSLNEHMRTHYKNRV